MIWWIRRDLRLADNQALTAALAAAQRVVPVFTLDPRLLNSPYVGARRTACLFGELRALHSQLRTLRSYLVLREGEPRAVLGQIMSACFDPEGTYIRKWVNRLTDISLQFIHAPWTVPLSVQREARWVIGRDNPYTPL